MLGSCRSLRYRRRIQQHHQLHIRHIFGPRSWQYVNRVRLWFRRERVVLLRCLKRLINGLLAVLERLQKRLRLLHLLIWLDYDLLLGRLTSWRLSTQ